MVSNSNRMSQEPAVMLSIVGALAVGLLVFSSALVAAQDTDEVDYSAFAIDELLGMDLVFGASRFEQKVSHAPSSVTVITGEEIAAHGYRTLDEVLESAAGFYVSYDRAYSFVGVRGVSQPDDYNTRILVLVDGHRINDNVYHQGSTGSEFPVDIGLIRRVEIIRGPSSSLYGSSAMFGVINVVTRSAADVDGSEMEARVLSEDGVAGRFTAASRADSELEWMVSLSGDDARGQDFYFAEYDDPSSNSGFSANNDGRKNVRMFAKGQWKDLRISAVHSRRDKTIPTGYYGSVFNDPGTAIRDDKSWVELAYDHLNDSSGQWMARVSVDQYRFIGWYKYDYADPGDLPYILTNRDESRGTWMDAEVSWNSPEWSGHRLSTGVVGRRNLEALQKNSDTETGDIHIDVDEASDEWGLYAQDEIRIGSRLRLNVGVRQDHYEGFGNTTNPRSALIVDVVDGTTLKLLYGTAFRAPNAYERLYGDGEYQKANFDLGPETMQSWEAIVEYQLNDRVRGSLSLFQSEVDDLIAQRLDTSDGLYVFQNAGSYSSRGLEVSLDGRLLSTVRGRGSYSFQDTELSDGEALANSPRHMAKLNLSAPLPRSEVEAALEFQYMSDRRTQLGTTADAALITNASFTQQLVHGQLAFTGTIYNLFDVEYYDPVSEAFTQEAIQQDGRTMQLRAVVSW